MANESARRPHWLEGVEVTHDAALLAVRKSDGTKVGYRIARRSLLDLIATGSKGSPGNGPGPSRKD